MPKVFLLALGFVLWLAASSFGQTTKPATKTVDLSQGFLIDIPGDWTRASNVGLELAFSERAGANLYDVFHLEGSRPTDLPYATIEQVGLRGMIDPTLTQQQQIAQQVADYYATAFNPPSKADRPPLFKSATVTPLVFDAANRRFTFSVVVKYDMIGEQHVEVSGCFGNTMFVVSSIWTDDLYYDANKAKILAMRDSLRLGAVPSATAKAGVAFKRVMQVGVAVIVIALAVIQTLVVLKSRRERRAEELRLLSQ